MIRKAVRIITVLVLVLSLSTAGAFAASSKTIPNTNAKADSRVVNAFVDLGFKVKYDKNYRYAGSFSVSKHAIIMKTKTKMHILHEMGHFVSEINNGAGKSKSFASVYKAEKSKYKGSQKSYILSTSEEYFAQSFAEYTSEPNTLKKSRPKTYNYIKTKVESINKKAIQDMYNAYSWAW